MRYWVCCFILYLSGLSALDCADAGQVVEMSISEICYIEVFPEHAFLEVDPSISPDAGLGGTYNILSNAPSGVDIAAALECPNFPDSWQLDLGMDAPIGGGDPLGVITLISIPLNTVLNIPPLLNTGVPYVLELRVDESHSSGCVECTVVYYVVSN